MIGGFYLIKETRHTGSFKAFDQHGIIHTIHIFTEIIDAGHMGDPEAEIEGLKKLQTDDGVLVNYLEKGKYKIAQTGQVLCSDDQNAP